MAGRYTADFLLHLRDSPLCVKPPGLPPAEEWMGPPPDTFRNQTKTTGERVKGGIGDGVLLNQENRRPALDRNGTRSAANPDDYILAPPRSSFASATAARNNKLSAEPDRGLKEPDRQDRPDRFNNLRSRAADSDSPSNDRFRDRDGRSNFRRRGDPDQDSDGWSTVRPRKSFGTEGAERFHMRAGGTGERMGGRDDRRIRDRDDREGGERRNRHLDYHSRDKDGDDQDEPRRNGPARGKSDSWFRDNMADAGNGDGAPVSQRERIDKAKSWRDRDPNANDRRGERTNDRNHDRRWDRDREQRTERDPEWLDEPAEEKTEGRTHEDFKKFMETMKARQGGGPAKSDEKTSGVAEKQSTDAPPEPEPKTVSVPAQEPDDDKFFSLFGSQAQFLPMSAAAPAAEAKEAVRPKPTKASSRFMNFLPSQENRARTEPPTPAATTNTGAPIPDAQSNNNEREAFAALISKLQTSRVGTTPEGTSQASQSLAKLFERPPVQQEPQVKGAVASPESFQQYGGEQREDPRLRGPPQHQSHHMISPRQMAPPTQPPPVSHPEQALQDLLAQRHNIPSLQNQGSARVSQSNAPMSSNTEFLMRLMQSHREVPEPPANRPELLVRMPQPTKQVSLANLPDREQDYQRERGLSQRQQYHQQQLQQQQTQQHQQVRGPHGPPGFLDDQFHSPDMDSRPQPTQILQRPPPPGLDHHGMHPFQMGAGAGTGGGPMPPHQQQRPMIPPPGLVNGPRNVNPPQSLSGMYPNYPPPGPGYGVPPPPPPEGLGNGLAGGPRGMIPPPGFFGVGLPPPGFMPAPPPGMSPGGFQGGPDGPGFPGGPFDRRGMLPPGYRGP